MKVGTIVKIKEDAISLYAPPVNSPKQKFVIVETDNECICMRLLVENNKLDWRIINAMLETLVNTGKIITKLTIIEPDIPDYIIS